MQQPADTLGISESQRGGGEPPPHPQNDNSSGDPAPEPSDDIAVRVAQRNAHVKKCSDRVSHHIAHEEKLRGIEEKHAAAIAVLAADRLKLKAKIAEARLVAETDGANDDAEGATERTTGRTSADHGSPG
jgi:hypothetical protein